MAYVFNPFTGTLDITGGASAGIAIGDVITSATQGSVLFAGVGGILAQDNANFYWDDTNNRFSVGTTSNYTSKLNILAGSTTEKGLVIRSPSSYATNYAEIQDNSGNVQLCIDSNYALATTATSTTQQIVARSRTNMGSVGGNFTFEIKRDGTNNSGNGAFLKLTDNAVSAYIKWIANGFTQNVMDLEFHNGNGKCYSAPSSGGNFYYNPVQNTTDISILQIPTQTMYPGGGTSSPQGLLRAKICTISASSTNSVADVATQWIEGAPALGSLMTITRRIASLIHTGDAAGYGQIIRGYTAQTQNLSEWQDVSLNVLGSIDANVNAKFQGIGLKVATKTTTYTAAHEHAILCDATSGAFSINLPAAASSTDRIYTIKKIDSSGNAVTIDGNASETIDGATTQSLAVQYQSITITCDGSNWFII